MTIIDLPQPIDRDTPPDVSELDSADFFNTIRATITEAIHVGDPTGDTAKEDLDSGAVWKKFSHNHARGDLHMESDGALVLIAGKGEARAIFGDEAIENYLDQADVSERGLNFAMARYSDRVELHGFRAMRRGRVVAYPKIEQADNIQNRRLYSEVADDILHEAEERQRCRYIQFDTGRIATAEAAQAS